MGWAYLRETKAFKKAVKLSAQGKRQMIWTAQISSFFWYKGNKKTSCLPPTPASSLSSPHICNQKIQQNTDSLRAALQTHLLNTTQSSCLSGHQRCKQTSFPRFNSRASQRQLKFTSKTRRVLWKLLLAARSHPPHAEARTAVVQP